MATIPLSSTALSTPSGDLELLSSIPNQDTSSKPAILCLHDAFCSAHDFQYFLPYFASRGYPAYSLSLRGHGSSWKASWFRRNLLTALPDYEADIVAALEHIRANHPTAPPPVVVGHSFGGGHLQYVLAREGKAPQDNTVGKVSGLVLLAAAPLSGGGQQIIANWELVEAGPKGYKYPWSPRSQLHTPELARAAFFHETTDEKTIDLWLKTCRTEVEGIRIGVSVFWPFGEAQDVLRGLVGVGKGDVPQRKVLCIAAELDKLVLPSMVSENVEVYVKAAGEQDQEIAMQTVVPDSAHHLAMDNSWEMCASRIIDWIEGREVV